MEVKTSGERRTRTRCFSKTVTHSNKITVTGETPAFKFVLRSVSVSVTGPHYIISHITDALTCRLDVAADVVE